MRYGRAITILLCLGSACADAAQDDIPIVEPPLPELPEGTRLEDVPEVDELPDWLIDIPPERKGATPSDRVVMQYEQADERVVSTSRMFAVSGGDAARMGAIAAHADELRVRLNQLLHLDSKWKFPIAIRVIGTTADAATPRPIRPQVQLLGDTPSLQLRIFAGGGISLEKLDAAIITLLLYEYAMRDIRPDALPDYLTLPPWLITGIQQAIFWKQDRVDRRLYQNLFNHTEMLAPEDIMESGDPEKMDAASRQLFEVSCGVLIMSLLSRKGGADQLRNLLGEALTQEGKLKEMLAAHFHALEAEGNSLSKWWALELAVLSQPSFMETLTPIETEKQLKEALLVTALDKETRIPYSISLTDLDALVQLPDWKEKALECTDRLNALSLHCFPGYRSIITEYYRAIGELVKNGKPSEVNEILIPLQELREAYMQASIRGRDYLDWYEINNIGNANRASFDTYLESIRLLRRESPGPSTPISRYLDDIEALHTLKEGEALPERLRTPGSTRRKKP